MIEIIKKRLIWLSISGVLVLFSIGAMVVWGLKLGIDFTGGSLLELQFTGQRPNISAVLEKVPGLDAVQPVDEDKMILRFKDVTEERHQEVLAKIKELVGDDSNGNNGVDIKLESNSEILDGDVDVVISSSSADEVVSTSSSGVIVEELRFDSVGPTIGQELKTKAINAIIIVLIAIVLYIAWVFRHVSKPVSSWKYGIAATIALFHDVIITIGIFAFLGYKYGVEVNTPFIAAILTVLGYSINDTIVVFDRIRENLPKSMDDFETTVNNSVNQTIKRSINTSLTTLLVLVSILLFGGDTIKSFVLALSIGIFVGTYSSIFIASPILVIWEKASRK